ncbi:MAG: MFS transporter [Capsulimonas sp.]|uniref:MFS transporter n=1 Tax=Capsulimonas sp. TaxID=2494211 RepID=UPI003267BECA
MLTTMRKHLFVLIACLFVVSIGFGVTLPVLPFYAERLAMSAGDSHKTMAWHVGMLTSVFSLMQLLLAPFWGRLSDKVGRRPLLLMGMAGYGMAQLLFGMATTLPLLYLARILGGILASATMPAAAAYVADATDEKARGRGMAWLGTAVSLGAVTGPALGGMVAWRDGHLYSRFGHLLINSFSLPFFAAALMSFAALLAALRWLPESKSIHPKSTSPPTQASNWREVSRRIRLPLGLSVMSQLSLALFETAFVLFTQAKLGYDPAQVAIAFMVCGSVMSVFQAGAVSYLSGRVAERTQISIGFFLMGIGLLLLLALRAEPLVYGTVGLIALGMAFVSPNLSTAISKSGGSATGAALGLQNSANNLGQALGPIIGAALFAWKAQAPYLLTSVSLLLIGILLGWKQLPVVASRLRHVS